jgi:hypothetical protein
MSAKPSPTQAFLAQSLPIELSNEETCHFDPANVDQINELPVARRPIWLAFAYFLIAVGIGVGATLAWQYYNGAAREAIAPAAALKAISADVDALRWSVDRIANDTASSREQTTQSIDQLAAQLAAVQEQITREVTAWQALQQYVPDKSSTPAPPAPRLSATQTSKPGLRPSQTPVPLAPAKNP